MVTPPHPKFHFVHSINNNITIVISIIPSFVTHHSHRNSQKAWLFHFPPPPTPITKTTIYNNQGTHCPLTTIRPRHHSLLFQQHQRHYHHLHLPDKLSLHPQHCLKLLLPAARRLLHMPRPPRSPPVLQAKLRRIADTLIPDPPCWIRLR